MTAIMYRKLDSWPQRSTSDRKSRSQFRTSYPDMLKHIEYEMERIDATDIVLEGFIPVNKIRRDGWPLSDTPAPHPGLRLSWQSQTHGPGELITDEYETWPANLRAVGLTLEALRAVGRYGAMARKQQYKGLVASPKPPPAPSPPAAKPGPPKMPALDPAAERALNAARFIARHGGGAAAEVLTSLDKLTASYKNAAANLHPDRQPHSERERFTKLFQSLQTAKEVMDKHHKERR